VYIYSSFLLKSLFSLFLVLGFFYDSYFSLLIFTLFLFFLIFFYFHFGIIKNNILL